MFGKNLFDMDSFGADEVVTLPPASKQNVRRTTAADNTTIVTFTVMFYYTPEVAEMTLTCPSLSLSFTIWSKQPRLIF